MSQAKICEMFQNKHFLCCHLSLVVKPVICVGAGRARHSPRVSLPVSHSPYCPGHTGTLSYYSAGLSEGWCNVNSRPSDNITKIIQVKEKF